MRLSIITPTAYIGRVSELLANRRGSHHRMEHIEPTRVLIEYDLPLAEMLTGFFDTLKSVSRGYASLDYNFLGYREADLVRLDIRVKRPGRRRPLDPRPSRPGPRHRPRPRPSASVAKSPASSSKSPSRPPSAPASSPAKPSAPSAINVLAKCYGRDVSRKKKLLESQKAGKRRMKRVGSVDIPQEAFSAVLQLNAPTVR